ncbi:MAG: DUF3147 family protein [Bacteroidota bacterium]|nr:DUF3147 family protein [Bacteroidota bacterium]
MYYVIKILVSSILILIISELSKKSSFVGSLFASLPLVSILAFIWLYYDTGDKSKISSLSYGVFWLVIPSLSLFISLPLLLKRFGFYTSLVFSISIMLICYYLMVYLLGKFGIHL